MKTLNYFLVAFAALALLACQKENDPKPDESQEPINVNLRIEGQGALSRSIESPAVANDVATLNTGIVFFLDVNNAVVSVRDLTLPNPNLSLVGQTFTGIKSSAKTVYVVGNFPTQNAGILNTLRASVNLAAIQSVIALTIDQQTGHKNVILANVIDLSAPYAQMDAVIKASTPPPPVTYTAQVLLGPVVARIQIADIKCIDPQLTGFSFKGIYIDNYYPQFVPSATIPGQGPLINIGQATTGLPQLSLLTDEVPVLVAAQQMLVSASMIKGSGVYVWAYQVPSTPNNTVPRIIVQLDNITTTAGVTLPAGPKFLTVTGFVDQNGTPITKFEAGKIYDIAAGSFKFMIKDLYPTPNPLTISVIVRVTVKPWQMVTTIPQL
ncbi:MAG: hypothetical protein RR980_03975 [Mucinivorans sp.]